MRRLISSYHRAARCCLSIVGCIPGAAAEQDCRADVSDSYGFGLKTPAPAISFGVDISEVTPERVGALKLKEEQASKS